jgi:hypothetical protein
MEKFRKKKRKRRRRLGTHKRGRPVWNDNDDDDETLF